MSSLFNLINQSIQINKKYENQRVVSATGEDPSTFPVKKVPFEKYPYIVAIRNGNFPLCVGIIISDKHVLTAARNLDKLENTENLIVVIGTSLMDEKGKQYEIRRIEIHDDYKRKDFKSHCYDIAIVEVNGSFNLEEGILKNAELTTKKYDDTKTAFLTGWHQSIVIENLIIGFSNVDAVYSKNFCHELHETEIFFSRKDHSEMSMISSYCNVITTNELDIGSPLVQDGKVIGILAYTDKKLGENGTRMFFVDIKEMELFINQTLKRLQSAEPNKTSSRFYVPTPTNV